MEQQVRVETLRQCSRVDEQHIAYNMQSFASPRCYYGAACQARHARSITPSEKHPTYTLPGPRVMGNSSNNNTARYRQKNVSLCRGISISHVGCIFVIYNSVLVDHDDRDDDAAADRKAFIRGCAIVAAAGKIFAELCRTPHRTNCQ